MGQEMSADNDSAHPNRTPIPIVQASQLPPISIKQIAVSKPENHPLATPHVPVTVTPIQKPAQYVAPNLTPESEEQEEEAISELAEQKNGAVVLEIGEEKEEEVPVEVVDEDGEEDGEEDGDDAEDEEDKEVAVEVLDEDGEEDGGDAEDKEDEEDEEDLEVMMKKGKRRGFRQGGLLMFLLALGLGILVGPFALLGAVWWGEVRKSSLKRRWWIAGVILALIVWVAIAVAISVSVERG